MLIALISDIHDHDTHLLLALQAAAERGCSHLIHMGDMTSASTFRILRDEWSGCIDLVFGNNEYELSTFQRMADQWDNTRLHGYAGSIDIDGRSIFFTHLPRDARKAVESGRYDAVFYGHTHCAEIIQIGRTLIVNPGEIQGRQSAPSFGVYNTETNTAEIMTF